MGNNVIGEESCGHILILLANDDKLMKKLKQFPAFNNFCDTQHERIKKRKLFSNKKKKKLTFNSFLFVFFFNILWFCLFLCRLNYGKQWIFLQFTHVICFYLWDEFTIMKVLLNKSNKHDVVLKIEFSKRLWFIESRVHWMLILFWSSIMKYRSPSRNSVNVKKCLEIVALSIICIGSLFRISFKISGVRFWRMGQLNIYEF